VSFEPIAPVQRVVRHSDQCVGLEAGAARQCRDFGGLEEARIFMRAARKQLQHVLCAENREQIRFWITIDGREDDPPIAPSQPRTRSDGRPGVRHVLEKLHAGNDVERVRRFSSKTFGSDQAILDLRSRFKLMQARDPERLFRQIDPGHDGAARRHRFGENAAAAADVQHALSREASAALVDVFQPQRVDVVQRLEVACRIPPAMRQRAELLKFGWIGVDHERTKTGLSKGAPAQCRSCKGLRLS